MPREFANVPLMSTQPPGFVANNLTEELKSRVDVIKIAIMRMKENEISQSLTQSSNEVEDASIGS